MRFARRLLIVGLVGGLLCVGVSYLLLQLDPVRFRQWVFQPVREITYFYKELDALHQWNHIVRVQIPEPEVVRIPPKGKDSVEIVASVYRPIGKKGKSPLLIALHGSYPWGRKAALIRLLGLRLSSMGWTMVAPDARGFGDTADPIDIENPQSWRTDGDLRRLIDYWVKEGSIDPEHIIVLGHSMGANHALEGGLVDSRVDGLILIGPGRYPNKIDEKVPDWERARFSADREIPKPISLEVARYSFTRGNIRLLSQSALLDSAHIPILIIDGELEGRAKLDYMRDIVHRLPGRVTYRTLQNTGHYCGVRSFYGSATVYYQPAMFEPFFKLISGFLDAQFKSPN